MLGSCFSLFLSWGVFGFGKKEVHSQKIEGFLDVPSMKGTTLKVFEVILLSQVEGLLRINNGTAIDPALSQINLVSNKNTRKLTTTGGRTDCSNLGMCFHVSK